MSGSFRLLKWAVFSSVFIFGSLSSLAYLFHTPSYLNQGAYDQAGSLRQEEIGGVRLNELLSNANIQSCLYSAPPCLWLKFEYERAVDETAVMEFRAKNSENPLNALISPRRRVPLFVKDYFRPRISGDFIPQVVPSNLPVGEQNWIVHFNSDNPLGLLGLNMEIKTCNGVTKEVALTVPLGDNEEGLNAVDSLLDSNPVYNLAVSWFGNPHSTELKRSGLKSKVLSSFLKPVSQDSLWLTERANVWYSWRIDSGDDPSNSYETTHSLRLFVSETEPCLSQSEVTEMERKQLQEQAEIKAKESRKAAAELYQPLDNRIFK